MILAGDIGGTKCNLAVFEQAGADLRPAFQTRYATRDFSNFEDLLDSFVLAAHTHLGKGISITAAGFGIAGTVVGGRLHAINLPWQLEPASLAGTLNLNTKNLVFMNDLVATACGIDRLEPQDFFLLNEVIPQFQANKALIAAGTGLGEAMLFWDGHRHVAAPSEGGAADFAPTSASG